MLLKVRCFGDEQSHRSEGKGKNVDVRSELFISFHQFTLQGMARRVLSLDFKTDGSKSNGDIGYESGFES